MDNQQINSNFVYGTLNDQYMKTKFILLAIILTSFACEKPDQLSDEEKLPKVETSTVLKVTWQNATVEYEVLGEGNSPIIESGIIISVEDSLPTFESEREHASAKHTWHTTTNNAGLGKFSSTFNLVYLGAGMTAKQTHYIRAYATNKYGTVYGKTLTAYPNPYPPEFYSISLVNYKATSASFICEMGLSEYDKVTICYSTSPNPSIEGTHSILDIDGMSLYNITGLMPKTKYYVRGYIKNASGESYSPEISFTTYDGEITDIDNNVYAYTEIGNQAWMASNLKVTKYNDGTPIPNNLDEWNWSTTSNGAMRYSHYNYYSVMNEKNVCPTGWHIPSDAEWKTLET